MLKFSLLSLITNQYFLLFSSIGIGLTIGNIKIKKFKLSTSGVLFISLLLSWIVGHTVNQQSYYINTHPEVLDLINNGFISKEIFIFSLIIFIASTGLIAGPNFISIIKKYGFQFPLIGIIITTGGYFSTKILLHSLQLERNITTGVFAGSLTSSPGLGTALENTSSTLIEAKIGLGYALSYIPGVISVITAMYLLPSIFNINVEEENKKFKKLFNGEEKEIRENLDFKSFSIVIIIGLIISKFKISFGQIKDISLGITGGTLIAALLTGVIGKIGNFNFRMKGSQLKFLQKLGLLTFLASIGLRYGFTALNGFNIQSLTYLLIALGISTFSILLGFLIGLYIFKMNWIILSGAICGGMTSTPGVSAAVEATQTDNVVISYGAVYPFALITMVLLLVIGL